ncbi:MAG: LiaF domain-containing protein [candidate division Zixibacteria bacterium]
MLKRSSAFTLVILLIISSLIFARDIVKIDKIIPADSKIKDISVHSDLDNAILRFSTHGSGDLLKGRLRYDADKMDVEFEYDDSKPAAGLTITADKLRRWGNVDIDDCRMQLSFSQDYIWEFDLDIGGAEYDFDFSGLPIKKLNLDIGAAEGRIIFEQPNPEKIRLLNIQAGAGDFEFQGLGYANFENFEFNCGAGEVELNFDGQSSGHRKAIIDVGIGDVLIDIPRDLPVRIETDGGLLSDIKIRRAKLEKVRRGVYQSPDYDDAEYSLEIEIDVGMGSAVISKGNSIMEIFGDDWDFRREGGFFAGHNLGLPEFRALPAIPAMPAPAAFEIPPLPKLPPVPPIPPIPAIPIGGKRIKIPD